MFIRYFVFLLCLFTINTYAQDYYDDYEYGDEYGYGEYGEEYGYDEYADEYGDEYADEYGDDEYGYDEEEPDTSPNYEILQNYTSPFIIDPNDPKLPPNHHISRLKGTVWRSDDTFLKTNSRGVISEHRLYIFFNEDRDAISYQYASIRSRDVPMWPDDSFFISLRPVLRQSDFIPHTEGEFRNEPLRSGDIQYNVNIPAMRNYQYEEVLKKLMSNHKAETNTIINPEINTIINPVTNPEINMVTNSVTNIVTNSVIQITTNFPQHNNDDNNYDYYHNSPHSPSFDDDFPRFNTDEFPSFIDNSFSFESMPTRLLAQELQLEGVGLLDFQYLVNVGEAHKGVFIHKTGDDRFPYKVIILQLDQSGVYLYEHHYDSNSPVVELDTQELKNMKRFQRVRLNREFLY